ncbi:hypothetical protein BDP27DRAFT_75220 [Rhodocollybia butyracea]|uniref:Transmembrane protein n=1 Tax=Rhodocollybia butyracea TaxID=206335 RepID=A0A9P5PKT4_9AGAR|nr:hypothetical protein BDP27DRAFT_75220 [Rhodocollybia butyracea]
MSNSRTSGVRGRQKLSFSTRLRRKWSQVYVGASAGGCSVPGWTMHDTHQMYATREDNMPVAYIVSFIPFQPFVACILITYYLYVPSLFLIVRTYMKNYS